MKKLLSFAMALCLCSSFSAFAANKAGDTTITDKNGNEFTLSKPILYTMTADDLEGKIYDTDYGTLYDENYGFLEKIQDKTIYAVPADTLIDTPDNTAFNGMGSFIGLSKHDNSYYIINDSGNGGDIWGSFLFDGPPSGGYFVVLFVIEAETLEEAYEAPLSDELVFYVVGDNSTENPFTSLPQIKDVNFSDVADGAYYETAMKWAVSKDITSGTSETTFSPNNTCTVEQIITLLWRQNGQPEPTIENPFSDVKESDYFYNAALWASEKGLVTGDKFNGSSPCTRIATVTYLYKLSDKTMGITPMSPFNDVLETSADYEVVKWAVTNNITSGTDYDTFSPNSTCTRGQIVTFLYRALLSSIS